MSFNEEYYIERINKMQAEIDEDEELLVSAKEKIDELTLKLSLSNSSFTKKGISEKQAKIYEDKIKELEFCLEAYSVDLLETKEDEIETFLKRVLKIKNEFNELRSHKRHRDSEYENFESCINTLSKDLATRFMELTQAIEFLNKSANQDENSEYIRKINTSLGVIKDVITVKENEYIRVCKENKALKADILGEDNIGQTKEELLKIIEDRELEIESLKDKIHRLEYENKHNRREEG